MAGNIKGIVIEFAGDTTKLDKALRQIRNSTKDIDSELKQVNKALKFNPTSVELWRQKQDLLRQKIQQTEANLKELKNIQAQMDAQGVDKQSEAYRRIQREITEAESKLKTFNTELRKIGQVNLRAMSEQFKQMGEKLTSAGQAMREISAAAAALAVSIGALTVKSGQYADELNTLSKKYHIGTDELQMYAAAAELVDVDVETIAKSHTKLEKSMASAQDGTGATADAFKALGVDVVDANGNLRDGDDVWKETIQALGQVENETERDALAMLLMGKSAAELNPLIEDGGEAYEKLAQTMEEYGLEFVDEETLNKANEFNDKIDTIKAMGMIAFQQLGATLAAYLAPALDKVVAAVGKFANWITSLDPKVLAIIATVAAVIAVLAPLLMIIGQISLGVSALISVFSLLAGPVGIVIAAIAALIAIGVLLYKNWDTIKAQLGILRDNMLSIWEQIKTFVTNTASRLMSGVVSIWTNLRNSVVSITNTLRNSLSAAWTSIKSTVSAAWEAIKSAIVTPIQSAKDTLLGIVNTIKSWFPIKLGNLFTFKLPHVVVGSKTVKVGDKDVTVPTFDINWYAQGGIFDSASLIGVGEAGAEAVVPLDRFWEEIRNSNERTDALLARQNQILISVLEEVSKEKDFKVDGMWAGRYVNSLVR